MSKIDYKKILEKLINEYPHNLDNIEKVIKYAKKNKECWVEITYEDIIKSSVWNADEKTKLIVLFGYNKCEHDLTYIDEYNNKDRMDAYKYTIVYDNLSGFEAIMRTYKDIERHYAIYKDTAYRNIIDCIINYAKKESVSKYMEIALSILTEEELKRLIKPYYTYCNYYKDYYVDAVHDESIMIDIIRTKDLNLIKKYIKYVDDVNLYISETVATGDIEIVKFFLSLGADINYYPKEAILGELTPLKTAINKNDYEMFKFLYEKGADINLQVIDEDFLEKLQKPNINIFGRTRQGKVNSENEESVQELKYIRESSPLEYASKLTLDYENHGSYNCFTVYFKGHNIISHYIKIDTHNIPASMINRGKVIDFIFDNLDNKSDVNLTDLIAMSFVVRDINMFNKYSKYAIDNNCDINFEYLFVIYLDFHLYNMKEMTIPFLDLLAKYKDKNNGLEIKLFTAYLGKNTMRTNSFYLNDFNREVLKRISEDDRKKLCLIPYSKDISTLNELISLGFDINQVDENGQNILFYLLCANVLDKDIIELFDYLVDRLDLSLKDKNGRNVLYYALRKIGIKDEYRYSSKEVVKSDNRELVVAKLITKMNYEDVCNDDTMQILENKIDYEFKSNCGEKIHYECIYQHHKDLFEALINKGFVLSDKLFAEIFRSLYPIEESSQKRLDEKVDIDKSLEFLYEKLDRNVEVQELNIEENYEYYIKCLNGEKITFENFKGMVLKLIKEINSLKTFYNDNISKRYSPEKYLEYVKNKYHTIYSDLDKYIVKIIIAGLRKFGNEKINEILDLCPNFDLNTCLYKENIGISTWTYEASFYNEYDEYDYPIFDEDRFYASSIQTDYDDILFTGGLIQYGILINDINLVSALYARGAKLNLIIDEKNYTWNYVNSYSMLNYMESIIGEKIYGDLNGDETSYYLKLINPNDDNASNK